MLAMQEWIISSVIIATGISMVILGVMGIIYWDDWSKLLSKH